MLVWSSRVFIKIWLENVQSKIGDLQVTCFKIDIQIYLDIFKQMLWYKHVNMILITAVPKICFNLTCLISVQIAKNHKFFNSLILPYAVSKTRSKKFCVKPIKNNCLFDKSLSGTRILAMSQIKLEIEA